MVLMISLSKLPRMRPLCDLGQYAASSAMQKKSKNRLQDLESIVCTNHLDGRMEKIEKSIIDHSACKKIQNHSDPKNIENYVAEHSDFMRSLNLNKEKKTTAINNIYKLEE